MQACKENAVVQRIECSRQIEWGQNGNPAFISTTKKAVRNVQKSCLHTVMCTVGRLEGLREIVGQQMAAKLMSATFSSTSERNGRFDSGLFFQKKKKESFFFRLFASRPGFRRRGVTTASLNCRGTDPDSSESFTILQIKGTKSSKFFFSKVVGMGSSHNCWVRNRK